jgi:broad specificity phosphatase PhoE
LHDAISLQIAPDLLSLNPHQFIKVPPNPTSRKTISDLISIVPKMAGRIHLVRHAESLHNVDKNFSRLDPGLTSLGKQQAASLSDAFPHFNDVGIFISSPLRRTIQTTLLAFPMVLDKRYYEKGVGEEKGVEGGAELVLDPLLQERSAEGCDTGSELKVLEEEFPSLDFSSLPDGWTSKEGVYAVDDEVVESRASTVREGLREIVAKLEKERGERRDVVVVTHGVFMKFLSGDKGIDLPKAGWKTFEIGEDGDGRAVLVPI